MLRVGFELAMVLRRKFLPGGDWPLERLAAASGVMERKQPFMLGSGVLVPKLRLRVGIAGGEGDTARFFGLRLFLFSASVSDSSSESSILAGIVRRERKERLPVLDEELLGSVFSWFWARSLRLLRRGAVRADPPAAVERVILRLTNICAAAADVEG